MIIIQYKKLERSLLMKALRIVISQTSANYRKEETVENKMTYPLPPFSTVIGAIHAACGYTDYHPMDISIQGKYDSMSKRAYTHYSFGNYLEEDHGYLARVKNNEMLTTASVKVATPTAKQKYNFYTGDGVHILDKVAIEEYRELKHSEMEGKDVKKQLNKFKNVTKSLKYYEILNGVTLIIHVRADEVILKDILDHVYDIKSIGRSEDMVNIKNAEIVELSNQIDDEIESNYAAYLDYDLVKNGVIFPHLHGLYMNGTRYYLNKDYKIEKQKRIFNKKKVVYMSRYVIESCTKNLLVDEYNGTQLIVNFL